MRRYRSIFVLDNTAIERLIIQCADSYELLYELLWLFLDPGLRLYERAKQTSPNDPCSWMTQQEHARTLINYLLHVSLLSPSTLWLVLG